MNQQKGFTIIELLVVIAIIGILSSVVLVSVSSSKQKAYYARSLAEFKNINTALELYKDDNDEDFPGDADRQVMPLGLESYIAGGVWPSAPWPGSYYDWDNWDDPEDSNSRIYQISIRFCTSGSNPVCTFPNTDWAEGFDQDSALYYCVSGSCRAHIDQAISHRGYCVNCPN